MGLENLKFWQWMIIGLVVGLTAGYARTSFSEEGIVGETLTQGKFEDLARKTFRAGDRQLQNIVIHQARSGGHIVYCKAPKPDPERGGIKYDPAGRPYAVFRTFYAPFPYKPGDKTQLSANATVVDYLKQIQRDEESKRQADPKGWEKVKPLTFKAAWWANRRMTVAIWTGGGLVVIGILFPLVINLLSGAGLGRAPREEKGVNLRNVKNRKSAAPALKPGMTAEDMARLAALEAQFEANLGHGAANTVTSGQETRQRTAGGPVPKIVTKPLAPESKVEKPKDDKDFGLTQQDYYPTEVHGKKKK